MNEHYTQPNDQAFSIPDVGIQFCPGLTIREYFAAKAMQGLLADPNQDRSSLVKGAAGFADELIKELNKNAETRCKE